MTIDRKNILLKLAKLGAMERYVDITTGELGDMLGMSQQSASLHLTRLEEQSLVKRIRRKSGAKIRITPAGIDLLDELNKELSALFDEGRWIKAKGVISTGLGEGAYYLSQEGYRGQLKGKFKIDPYPGTLNIILSSDHRPLLGLLRKGPGTTINGFSNQGRTFGTCICYRCRVEDLEGIVMVPDRSIHENTLEVVSDVNIRNELGLEDGSPVEMYVEYPSKQPINHS